MFDTMTLTKTAGALCGSLLVFLLGSWAATALFSTGGGHGEDRVQGFVVDTGSDEVVEEVVDEGPDLATRFAAADAARGEKVFNKCKACHQLEDGANGVGPHLYGVVGRDVGGIDGFNYSGALTKVAEVWGAEELYAFLENPSAYAPGTSMGFAGLNKSEERVDLIAYLDATDGVSNIVFEAAAEAPEPEASAEPAADVAPQEQASDETSAPETAEAEAPADAAAADTVAEDPAVDEPATEVAAADETAAEKMAETDAVTEEQSGSEPTAGEAMLEKEAGEMYAMQAEQAAPEAAAEAAPEAAPEASVEQTAFAAMVASADAAAGEKLFRRCAACHAVEAGKNKVGPSLHGVVGRDIAAVEGFTYSDALKGLDGVWTADRMSAWLENPRAFAAGNRMGYPGLKDEQDRANVIRYIESVSN